MNCNLVNSALARTARDSRPRERGYTLLFAVFLVALALIATTIAVPSILTQGRREQELEMVWRGKQYEKAIGRYTRKFNRNPTKIDDLVKGTNGVRFLRQAYKDPMNDVDGSWRLIYVTGGGALIGSVRYTSLQQMAMMDRMAMGQSGLVAGMPGMPGMGGMVGIPGAGLVSGLAGSSFGAGAAGAQPGGMGGAGPTSQGNGQSSQGNSTDSSNGNPQGPDQPSGNNPPQNPPGSQTGFGASGSPGGLGASGGFGGFGQSSGGTGVGSPIGQPIGSPLETTTIGGSIAGVGSKIDKPSLIVYKSGKKYKQWEFIFNPLEQQLTVGVASSGVPGAVPAGQANPAPFGGQGSGPIGGQPIPPELPQPPSQQPPPQQQQ